MKKWLKILISTTVVAGVVATASYFSAVAIIDKIKKDNGTKTFVEKIETNDYYHIKHLELEFYDKDTAHNFGLHFSNVFINSHNDSYNFEGNLSVEYDFMEVYSGYSTYINKTFYLETYDSIFTNENIYFDVDSLTSFRSAFKNSTLTDTDIFHFEFGFDFLKDMSEKTNEVKKVDETTHLFEFKVPKYNSSLLFYTDGDYNLYKLKTSTAFEYENTLLSINASNISFIEKFEIRKKDAEFNNLSKILKASSYLLDGFNVENGKGICVDVGNKVTDTPIEIYRKNRRIFEFLGKIEVFNKTEYEDFLLKYTGNILIDIQDYELMDFSITFFLYQDIIYFQLQDYNLTKGSVKLSTLEEALEFKKDEAILKIKSLLFNIVDLIGINASFNEDYKFISSLKSEESSIDATFSIPVTQNDTENKEISVKTTFNEDRYKEISTSDISYENYTIKNLILGFEDEISERPTINFDDYTSYDEFILNLLSF